MLSQACGRPTQVVGDVFITRTCDDGRDKFERYDFKLDEFSPRASWIAEASKGRQDNPSPSTAPTLSKANTKPNPKALPSKATIDGWQAQLDAWVEGKLKQWDDDEEFRAARQVKHKDRVAYQAFLLKKADSQLQAKLRLYGSVE